MLWELIGWIGVAILVATYALLSLERLKPSFLFQALNLVGATAVGMSALMRGAYAAAGLEGAWFIIASLAIVRLLRKTKTPAT
jgi:hypothetical protein